MREFRAWNKVKKVMFTPENHDECEYLMIGIDGRLLGVDNMCWDGGANDYDSWSKGNPWEVMWETGLKDMFERKIFEGDVVKITMYDDFSGDDNIFTGGIVFDAKEAKYRLGGLEHRMFKLSYAHTIEVIGNIYENPELLTEGK